MKRIIRELRRREVFRTAGLYVGVCWIAIEAASVLLPTFDAPAWIMRAIVIVAIVGFPVMLVLAWVYDISESGIEVQADATDAVVAPLGGRRMDFIVIGVLAVALMLSVYMNLRTDPEDIEPPDPVSVLISDFDNRTGDPVFDGAVEQSLNIGIEGASFITAFNRNAAQLQIEKLKPGSKLDEEGARLVAVREGIKLVLTGLIEESGGRYEFTVHAIEPESGEVVAEADQQAEARIEVLSAVSQLAEQIRKELGDTEIETDSLRAVETFTAGSLQAAQHYTHAQNLAYLGDYDQSLEFYAKAIESDPAFGRAYSGWALAAFNLGRNEEAEDLWQKALSYMDSMTERERYRTLGLYYMAVSNNYDKAIESYESLVENFPADGAGHNNLAVAYFTTLNFERAMAEGQAVLEIYPSSIFYRQNYSLYAMYAGEFELAESRAREVIESDSSRYYAWLPIAIGAMSRGDIAAAEQGYNSMSATGEHGSAMGNLGKADIALFKGDYQAAIGLLEAGIAADEDGGNTRTIMTKRLALAGAHARLGNNEAAAREIGMAAGSAPYRQVPAALVSIEVGDHVRAAAIADELLADLRPRYRAYGRMLHGVMQSLAGDHADALDNMRKALDLYDSWLVRFHLGRAYLAAGLNAEAMDEFEICEARRGEASAVFLDDLPSWRLLATLPYWQGRAMEAIGMAAAAQDKFRDYIELRPESDPLAQDALRRVAR